MQRRRRKSHRIRNASIAIVSLIVIISLVVVVLQMNGSKQADVTPPTYSDVSSSSTTASSSCNFSVLWADDANVSGYIFETNNTGVFVNDTWVSFSNFASQTSAYSRVTKTLDNTIGDVVEWRFWCNDTNNNWNVVSSRSLFVDSDKVLIVTSMGNITIELYDDMPITTGNFKNLVATEVYDGTIFHRIAPGFVIQGGDATPKGITVPPIKDELPNPIKHSNIRGSIAMAKTSSKDSATSQFFINLNDTNAANLDGKYSVFGTVITGMDIVDTISHVPISPPNDGKPLRNVTLISARFIK